MSVSYIHRHDLIWGHKIYKSNKKFIVNCSEIWKFVPKFKIIENSLAIQKHFSVLNFRDIFLGTLALKCCDFSPGCNIAFIKNLDSPEIMLKILFSLSYWENF